ncbi:MAG: hypothetical protein ACO25B_13740 [Chitinophagaceae bacterium]
MNQFPVTAPEAGKSRHFFRKPQNAPLCFALALLLFLLPFAEFKCANMTLLGNTGIGIAIGREWKVASGLSQNEFMKKLDDGSRRDKDFLKDKPNIFALLALGAGIFGLLLGFINVSWRSLAGMCAGILGALMLIAMMIQLKVELQSLMQDKPGRDGADLAVQGILKLKFTIWYFISLVSFVAAAFFHYIRGKIALQDALDNDIEFEFRQPPPGETGADAS